MVFRSSSSGSQEVGPSVAPRRILVADDEELTRHLTGGLVEQMGHEVILAKSGEEALGLLDDSIDMALLDVLMPGMDGFELTTAIRNRDDIEDIPIILITSLNGRKERLEGARAGANDFITKPVNKTELAIRMQSLLRMRDYQQREREHRQKLARTVEELERARSDMEDQVEQRTRELLESNRSLEREISRRQSAQMELQLLEEIFKNSLQGITITDANADIIKINPAFSAITGYSPTEVEGRNPRVLKSDKHEPRFYRRMWEEIVAHDRWSGEIWNRRKSGDIYPEWLNIFAFRNEEGEVVNYAAIFHDLSENKKKDERIAFQSQHDALTELPNRNLLLDRLRVALKNEKRTALLCIDINNFKHINDSYGYRTGDSILQEVARRLEKLAAPGDTVARVGGDLFAFMMHEPSDVQEIAGLAREIQKSIATPIKTHGGALELSSRIGISIFPDDSRRHETLLGQAELAMERTGDGIHDRFRFFTSRMNRRMTRRMELERKLRSALANEEFRLYYQPKIEIATRRVTGWEALLRWENDGQIISPAEFIPLTEETGQIVAIGEWVIARACRDMKQLGLSDRTVSVNLSPLQFGRSNLAATILSIVSEHEIKANRLELEITENNAMTNVHESVARLKALSRAGFRLSIDDFGTGYSSLYYLKEFPIDVLKIDKSFVLDLEKDASSSMIVASIIDMAKNFRLKVVAEGVETAEQLQILTQLGCDQVQGYYFGKPVPVDQILTELPDSE